MVLLSTPCFFYTTIPSSSRHIRGTLCRGAGREGPPFERPTGRYTPKGGEGPGRPRPGGRYAKGVGHRAPPWARTGRRVSGAPGDTARPSFDVFLFVCIYSVFRESKDRFWHVRRQKTSPLPRNPPRSSHTWGSLQTTHHRSMGSSLTSWTFMLMGGAGLHLYLRRAAMCWTYLRAAIPTNMTRAGTNTFSPQKKSWECCDASISMAKETIKNARVLEHM